MEGIRVRCLTQVRELGVLKICDSCCWYPFWNRALGFDAVGSIIIEGSLEYHMPGFPKVCSVVVCRVQFEAGPDYITLMQAPSTTLSA
jgi:hypothetical protein